MKPDEELATMFWIHGGGFVEWSGNDQLFGPDFLIEQRVIVVTSNYRLGVFGFLSFGTPEYSGNMGMKDQQMALKWVYENIDRFSGDNKRITIFGQSAGKTRKIFIDYMKWLVQDSIDKIGGSATHLQFLSTESQKYFNNAIILSGTAISLFSLRDESEMVSLAYQIAKDLGEPKTSSQDLIKFFKSVLPEKIVSHGALKGDYRTMTGTTTPIVES